MLCVYGVERACRSPAASACLWRHRHLGLTLNSPASATFSVQVRKNVKGLRDFKQSSVEPDSVPYLDAAREKARLKQLKRDAAQNGGSDDRGGKSKGGCKAEQKQARAKAAAEEAERLRKAKKMPAAKRQKLQSREDDDDLDDDYRAYRKHKKGKLDDATYKRSIGLVD